MSIADWYIAQFRDTLGEPLRASDGIPDSENDDQLGSRRIPTALRDYYRVAGNHWLNTNHNHLRPLSALETVDGYTIFMDENQVIVQWALRNSDREQDDPIVYQGQLTNSTHEWHPERYSFSRFIIAMWRWTLTGEDPE
ncbi:MAG: hypothetical protein KDA52_05340 [Planctomycetaceae bacterium]|nr:hypothetical protein [Planctomycetaceae bacterium]